MSTIHSVGTLYAIQDLFLDLERRKISADEFRLCFIKFGTSTAKEVYDLASSLNWICTSSEGEIVPTEFGKAAHPQFDRPKKLRFQLKSIIQNTRPPWAALLVNGRKEASLTFPTEVRQCFKEALLLDSLDEDIVEWWDRLSAFMREEAAQRRSEIGRLGERLTLKFELERTKKAPKWQAFETNFAGYDVLSTQSETDTKRLKIEVKASTRGFGEAMINITEHEWITAQASPNDYVFHVWLISEGQPKKYSLFTITTPEIAPHIPLNQGKGNWKQTAIRVGSLTHPSKGSAFQN